MALARGDRRYVVPRSTIPRSSSRLLSLLFLQHDFYASYSVLLHRQMRMPSAHPSTVIFPGRARYPTEIANATTTPAHLPQSALTLHRFTHVVVLNPSILEQRSGERQRSPHRNQRMSTSFDPALVSCVYVGSARLRLLPCSCPPRRSSGRLLLQFGSETRRQHPQRNF